MPRARNIKPAFFANDLLVEIAFEYRLLFIGLWTIADREGRLLDRPKKIRMELFPADDVDVDRGLSLLAERGFITRYSVASERFIAIDNFGKHQNPHKHEKPSTIPAPCKPGASTVQARGESDAQPVEEPAKGRGGTILAAEYPERAGLIPDPLNLIPETPPKSPKVDWGGFEEFYAAYPKKQARPAALKAWNKLKPDDLVRARIQKAIAYQRQSQAWTKDDGQFVPLPATYLNQRRWEDDVTAASNTTAEGEYVPPGWLKGALN